MTPVGGIDLGLMLVLGLASSLHCAGMCGPLICVASVPLVDRSQARPCRYRTLAGWQWRYQASRGLSYALLGALLALAGTAIGNLFPTRLVGGVLQLAAGLLLVALGVWQFVRRGAVPAGGEGWLTRALRRAATSGHGWGSAGLGLLTGLLPCGVLYAAFARAVVAGSAASGALVMLAFWLGTVPLLASMGMAAGGLVRVAGRLAAPALLIAMVSTGGLLAGKGWRNLSTSPVSSSAGAASPHAGSSAPSLGRHPALQPKPGSGISAGSTHEPPHLPRADRSR